MFNFVAGDGQAYGAQAFVGADSSYYRGAGYVVPQFWTGPSATVPVTIIDPSNQQPLDCAIPCPASVQMAAFGSFRLRSHFF
jgi:hypothetical protein